MLRTLWVTAQLYGMALFVRNVLDPMRTWMPDWAEVRAEVVATIPWLGAILGAVYAAFYARFAAQWSYLATVYHQIKAAETSLEAAQRSNEGANASKPCKAMAQWKAGFIEDADTLHLARKPAFASTILAWGRLREVREAFASGSPGGSARLDLLLKIADCAHTHEAAKWPTRNGAPEGRAAKDGE